MMSRLRYLGFFLPLFLFSAADAQAQVFEEKGEYSHRFIHARPGDTTRRTLRFDRSYAPGTQTLVYHYAMPGFDTDPYRRSPARRLADEIPFYDTLLRAAAAVRPDTGYRYLVIGGPFEWADVMAAQVRLFTTHPQWLARPRGMAGSNVRHAMTLRLMKEAGVYAAVDAWLAPHGLRIAEIHGAKVSLLRAADLRKMGYEVPADALVPVPNEFGLRLERVGAR